jgi:hypothetical protein
MLSFTFLFCAELFLSVRDNLILFSLCILETREKLPIKTGFCLDSFVVLFYLICGKDNVHLNVTNLIMKAYVGSGGTVPRIIDRIITLFGDK